MKLQCKEGKEVIKLIVKEMQKLLRNNILIILIIIVGLFLRVYNAREYFFYSHDQDLAGWFIRDVVENKHLRLVGQETSTQGIYIGPLYYYLLIPFYFIFAYNPLGGLAMVNLLGLLTIYSFYYVFSKTYSKKSGLVAALIYTFSFYSIFNDREVVPTMPVILWTVWFYYGINLILEKELKKAFFILGTLIGLIWHINLALVLLIPLIFVALFLSAKKDSMSTILGNLKFGLIPMVVLTTPLLFFEIRHNFLQTGFFIKSLTTNQNDIVSGSEKFIRVIYLLSKNLSSFIWGEFNLLNQNLTLFVFVLLFIFLLLKNQINKNKFILLTLWLVFYVTFFSFYSKIVSEYYLNGTILVWIIILTLSLKYLLDQKRYKYLGGIIIIFICFSNFYKFKNFKAEKVGYNYKMKIIEEIKNDSLKMNYPCVSVSYITDPGYEFGYRYLFYLVGLKVNRPATNAPVYTIVYPLNDELFPVDVTFGALGLIYPDYSRYTKEGIEKSCSGENQNLTEPMWGMPY